MKTVTSIFALVAIIASSFSLAGMLHPLEQDTPAAREVEATPVLRSSQGNRVSPSRNRARSSSTAIDPSTYKLPFFLRKGAIFSHTLSPKPQTVKIPSLKPWIHKQELGLEFPKLKSNDRSSILKYAQEALGLPIPKQNYKISRRAQDIEAAYKEALHPHNHKSLRTTMNLPYLKPYPLATAFPDVSIQQKQDRIEALLLAANENYAQSIVKFWTLKNSLENPPELVARDSVLAALVSLEAGWQSSAFYFFDDLPRDALISQPRYLRIFSKELDRIHSQVLVDQIIGTLNLQEGQILDGDKANFALAKKILRNSPDRKNVAELFSEHWKSSHYRDQLDLLLLLKNSNTLSSQETEKQLEALPKRSFSLRNDFKTALARNFVRTNSLEEAHDLYQSITRDGTNRLDLLQEQAYVEMKQGNVSASLGKSVGAQSKFFEYGFAPDAHLIEIESRKTICDFGGAEKSLRYFYQNYKPELDALNQILDKETDPRILYETLMSKSADMQPYRYQRFLLHTPNMISTQNTLVELRGDLNALNKKSEGKYFEIPQSEWTEMMNSMNRHWNRIAQQLKVSMAEAASFEMKKMKNRLEHIFGSLDLLEIDIASAGSTSFQLEAALNFPAGRKSPPPNLENKNHWGFEGEIWEDELDHLVVKTNSKCPQAPIAQKVSSI